VSKAPCRTVIIHAARAAAGVPEGLTGPLPYHQGRRRAQSASGSPQAFAEAVIDAPQVDWGQPRNLRAPRGSGAVERSSSWRVPMTFQIRVNGEDKVIPPRLTQPRYSRSCHGACRELGIALQNAKPHREALMGALRARRHDRGSCERAKLLLEELSGTRSAGPTKNSFTRVAPTRLADFCVGDHHIDWRKIQ
jgi:hypothetical protein